MIKQRYYSTDPRQCPAPPSAFISCCCLAFLIKTSSTRPNTSLVRNSKSACLQMGFAEAAPLFELGSSSAFEVREPEISSCTTSSYSSSASISNRCWLFWLGVWWSDVLFRRLQMRICPIFGFFLIVTISTMPFYMNCLLYYCYSGMGDRFTQQKSAYFWHTGKKRKFLCAVVSS